VGCERAAVTSGGESSAGEDGGLRPNYVVVARSSTLCLATLSSHVDEPFVKIDGQQFQDIRAECLIDQLA